MAAEFKTRTIVLIDEQRRKIAISMVENMPIGTEVVARAKKTTRTIDQNALMWAGPLHDIATQGWVNGRQFSAEAWHEHFKREFLPEANDPEIERLVKNVDTWRKWGTTPGGERILEGSTGALTKYGFSCYIEQIYAFGAGIGVLFSAGVQDIGR